MRNTFPLFALLFIFGAILAALIAPPSAVAQSNSCIVFTSCGYSSIGGPCSPPLPSGAYDCQGANFTTTCKLRTYHCVPPKSLVENPRCIECEKAAKAGSPINLANGNVFVDQTDLSLPGLGGGFVLTRAWNSLWPTTQLSYRTGMFGPNWVSNLEERVFVGGDNYVKYLRSDGNFWSFGYSSSNWLPSAPANAPAVLTQSSTNWVLTFKNGEQRLFSLTSGLLTGIVDRNGNTTALSYDGLNRLVTVTDPASRHFTFTYASSTSYLVTNVSSDAGLSLTYSYDGSGRLHQVVKPDQSTLNYEYDSSAYYYVPNVPNPYLTAIKDGNGKVLESHTYDCYGRGLTSARAGGVDAVTVTYSNNTYSGACTTGRGID